MAVTSNGSPFSLLNNLKIKAFNNKHYLDTLTEPTIQEIILLNILRSVKTAAGFQLEWLWGQNGRRKLKKLARQGVIYRYKLQGQREMNVYSIEPISDLDTALRRMAFAQLYIKIREVMPCSATVQCPKPFTGVVNFNKKAFPVLVLRRGDSTKLLPGLLKGVPRLIIVAEEFKELRLGVPYRLVTDHNLLYKPLHRAFLRPDGTPDEVPQFAPAVGG